jgi:hypothetical protein
MMRRVAQSLCLRLLLAGSLCAGSSGCATSGTGAARPVTQEAVAQVLAVGISTRDDVAASMGVATVRTFPSGYEVWVYQYQVELPTLVGFIPVVGDIAGAYEATRRKRELAILFDKDGVVRKYRLRVSASQVEQLLTPR